MREALRVRCRILGGFSPADRCPAYRVPEEIATAVSEKQRRDDIKTAELINRGTPAAPVKMGIDGGMNATFLTAVKSHGGPGAPIRTAVGTIPPTSTRRASPRLRQEPRSALPPPNQDRPPSNQTGLRDAIDSASRLRGASELRRDRRLFQQSFRLESRGSGGSVCFHPAHPDVKFEADRGKARAKHGPAEARAPAGRDEDR